MNITEYVDNKVMQEIQDMFAASTGVVAVITDPLREMVTQESYPLELGVDTEKMDSRDLFYQAGALTVKKEIIVDNGLAGYVSVGNVAISKQEEAIRQLAAATGKDADEYVESLKNIPEKTDAQIDAAADLLKKMVECMAGNAQKENAVFEKMVPQLERLTTVIREIAQSAKKLEGIAFKQNILALNASIEAARAGDIGKGFAVVAQEMGNMTKNSSEIYGGIEDKVKELEGLVGQMSVSKEKDKISKNK